VKGEPSIIVNNEKEEITGRPPAYHTIRRTWHRDRIHIEFRKALTASPLPDKPDTVAFLDGPVVLAGLCDEQWVLVGDAKRPGTMLIPDNEREWGVWKGGYRTLNQDFSFRFIPLYEVHSEPYTVYFPVKKQGSITNT